MISIIRVRTVGPMTGNLLQEQRDEVTHGAIEDAEHLRAERSAMPKSLRRGGPRGRRAEVAGDRAPFNVAKRLVHERRRVGAVSS